MKIGILTLFFNNMNWGGVLQGYALKTYLERRYPNATVDILKYQSGKNIVYSSRFQQALQYSPVEILKRLSQKKEKETHTDTRKILEKRAELFLAFTADNTSNPRVYTDSNLIHAAEEYDVLICGSDQIWNPNVSKPGYYLQSVTDECVKVSYAASIARDSLTKHEQRKMLPLIKGFDAVSVREKTAKQFLEDYSGGRLSVEEVLDPALMLTKEDWTQLSGIGCSDKKYALCFFFSDSLDYRRHIENYCQERGLEIKLIAFAKNEYLESDTQGEGERLFDVGPREFIQLFQEAHCVFTDSFHGAVFSILFSKPFCVFERDKNNKVSKNSRLYDLLRKFDLYDRLVTDCLQLAAVLNNPIDFSAVDEKLNNYRLYSDRFLSGAIARAVTEKDWRPATVGDLKDYMCCGCGLCIEECPQKCIELSQDEEGFYYPSIDSLACIKCGKCLSSCTYKKGIENPVLGPAQCFIGYNKDETIRNMSSSGGLFYEIGKSILEQSGVVYGAAFDTDFSVRHIRIDKVEQLKMLQTSKYVQSRLDDIFKCILVDLKQGKPVLFSGTPCQVAAVNSLACNHHLEKSLFLVDIICHGVPSPELWNSYMTYKQGEGKKTIINVNFRDKTHGAKSWHDYCLFMEYSDGSSQARSHDVDAYMQTFLSNQNIRPSCFDCVYKDYNYRSDMTMGDAWKVEKTHAEWADDKGTSLIIIRSKKGMELLKDLPDSFCCVENSYRLWEKYNPSLVQPSGKSASREALFAEFSERKDDQAFWSGKEKIAYKQKVKHFAKKGIKKLGLDVRFRGLR